ncbi:hypothetical protein [uncultured Pseudokineococcus sp.]|uniref:hypothetical protein n=1 Tax=uncultured Pseudokineococcus sp. TaxID=1642928 RepID=UPI002610208B|nr:hypothetical protein [uncultured Pseudokineococcus sp.]
MPAPPAPPPLAARLHRAAALVCLGAALTACTGGGEGVVEDGGVQAPPPAAGGAAVEVPEETLVGWSAAEVPGLEQEIIGTWMARDGWEDLRLGHWLADNPDYAAYVGANPDGAADVGVPLVPHDSEEPVDALLASALSGDHDDDYRAMGAELARTGPRTVYARPWWEMNLEPGAEEIDREAFRGAWSRAVPLVREGFAAAARPGQELSVVFSPNADGAGYREFYPDGEHVDLVALDVYGQRWGATTPEQGELLDLVAGQLRDFAAFAEEVGKPVALAEWGNVAVQPGDPEGMQGLGDAPAYVDLVAAWAQEHDAVYLVYFNSADGGVGQTLTDTPDSLEALVAASGQQAP